MDLEAGIKKKSEHMFDSDNVYYVNLYLGFRQGFDLNIWSFVQMTEKANVQIDEPAPCIKLSP